MKLYSSTFLTTTKGNIPSGFPPISGTDILYVFFGPNSEGYQPIYVGETDLGHRRWKNGFSTKDRYSWSRAMAGKILFVVSIEDPAFRISGHRKTVEEVLGEALRRRFGLKNKKTGFQGPRNHTISKRVFLELRAQFRLRLGLDLEAELNASLEDYVKRKRLSLT